jgi:hypothetical protein
MIVGVVPLAPLGVPAYGIGHLKGGHESVAPVGPVASVGVSASGIGHLKGGQDRVGPVGAVEPPGSAAVQPQMHIAAP